jgi:DNA-binding Lrp family transcriptional regulator
MLVHELEEISLRTDDLDRKILARLVENGRETFAALGQRVGLSTAATKRRVDRLRSEGVIRRFTADLEPAMGWTIDAFVELCARPGAAGPDA